METPGRIFEIFTKPEPLMIKEIIQWAQSLPDSRGGVLDLAAGIGVDVSNLINQGINARGQDKDSALISLSPYSNCLTFGQAENLNPYPDEYFSGFLLKYALAFLDDNQRQQMFQEAQRTLVQGGSFKIINEHNPYNLASITEPDGEFQIEDPNRQSFIKTLNKIQQRPRLVQYSCLPEEVQVLAINNSFDFAVELIPKYIPGNGIGGTIVHPLVRESRFPDGQSNLFIATLTKI